MCKKCWLAFAALVALVGMAAILVVLLLPPTPGITYANFSRIEIGMSRAEVEALLGPAHLGTWDGDLLTADWLADPDAKADSCYWRNDSLQHAQVYFDASGRVKSATWNGWPDNRGVLEKLRDRTPFIAREPPPSYTRLFLK